jgi:putative peptidoglycan lipid II flippase
LGKLSRLTRISVLLAVFFAMDKGLAIIRQVLIARWMGFSAELDAFNVANNIPDMLYALISGGALAIAFIPVLSEVMTKEGRDQAWGLFSRVANLAFIVTAAISVVVAVAAVPLVQSEVGIAPGFGPQQQALVANLMRLNLLATLIFSISGLVMAGLQANQHFLLPAAAPLLYNVGQIFGVLVLARSEPLQIGPITIPGLGLGIHGLVYGVLIGAFLHLAIQIPGLVRYKFRWTPRFDLTSPGMQKVLRLMGPRVVTMFFIQLIFIIRDNLASRLAEGSVTALTYGWMIQQVPETLIGTAIGTALLPTLAELVAREERLEFKSTIERAVRVLVAVTIPVAVVVAFSIKPLLGLAFGLDGEAETTLLWVTRGFLLGLTAHCLQEVAARSFYARQDAITPLIAAAATVAIYIGVGSLLYRRLGAPGISLTDAIAYTTTVTGLLVVLSRRLPEHIKPWGALLRGSLAGVAALAVCLGVFWLAGDRLPGVLVALVAALVGVIVALPIIWRDARMLLHL